jgi:ribose-phosphate pyrophosphokinase
MSRSLFFPLPGNEVFAERLAAAVDGECGLLSLRDFPDGESYVRVDTDPVGRDVQLVATLRHPNDETLPLIFLADAVRELGATRVGLIAPYLAYMRQDTRFRDGEAITSRSYARIISRAVDSLLTVDPHLHRVTRLRELYSIPATAIHVATEIGLWIAANVKSPLIIGPDQESRQWVEGIAAAAGAPSTVLTKTRRGDTHVIESALGAADHRACTPVLVDDIIATGETMVTAIRHLREQGRPPAECVGVHGVFADGAYASLKAAGAARVVTTNTIAHPSNCIDITPAVARALQAQIVQV